MSLTSNPCTFSFVVEAHPRTLGLNKYLYEIEENHFFARENVIGII